MIITVKEHGRTTAVEITRTFKDGFQNGVGQDGESWFVYSGPPGDVTKHCGPYSTREQAKDWIDAIRETD